LWCLAEVEEWGPGRIHQWDLLTSKKLHINIFYIVLYMERENVVHNPLILYLHFISILHFIVTVIWNMPPPPADKSREFKVHVLKYMYVRGFLPNVRCTETVRIPLWEIDSLI
jgi:hypothetical protein